MKILIIICAVVLLLQIGALGLSFGTGSTEKPTRDEVENGDWDPEKKLPAAAARFESLLDKFRPRLDLPWEEQFFPSGDAEPVIFRNGGEGDKGRRVAKFELVSGTGVSIGYSCSLAKPDYECPQTVCLCSANAPVDALARSACASLPPVCPADGNLGEIVVYGETGTLEFSGLGAAGGKVRQR
jgi:hypothetical protein